MQLTTTEKLTIFNNAVKPLAKLPLWTVSAKTQQTDKLPLNMNALLSTGEITGFTYKDTKSLTALTELEASPATKFDNRTLRVATNYTGYLVLDVENQVRKEDLAQLKKLPIVYMEHSMHYGWHILVKVPDDILRKNFKLLNSTVVKYGNVFGSHSGIEVIMNNHFVTFTRNAIKLPDYYLNPTPEQLGEQMDAIDKYLTFLQTAAPAAGSTTGQLLATSNIANKDEKAIAAVISTTNLLNKIKRISPNNYLHQGGDKSGQPDMSHYEFAVAIRVVSMIRYKWFMNRGWAKYDDHGQYPGQKVERQMIKFEQADQKQQASELIWTAALLLKSIIPYRQKHDTDRDGLPYLTYICNKALIWIDQKH